MMSNEIQKMLIDRNMKKSDLAAKCGWTASNLGAKLKRDNFTENELLQIAEALNCDLSISLKEKQGE